jgi:FecR-like protein
LTRRRLSLALLLMFGFMLNPDADALAASGMAHMAQAQPAPAPSPPAAPAANPPAHAEAQTAAAEPIGNVASLTGSASVTRNSATTKLELRDDIFAGDVVETGAKSALGITFADATTFNLTANAKITIDHYLYEEGGQQNGALFDVAKGTLAFVAASVAKTGDMRIATPTATLGIRGTTGLVEVPEGATATSNNVAIKLYPDADGRVGRIEINDRSGAQLGALTRGASGFAIRGGVGGARLAAVPLTISPQQVLRDQGFVRQLHATQDLGRRMVDEQRAFRRANPGQPYPNRGQPLQPGPQRQNGVPGPNRTTPPAPGQPGRQEQQPGQQNRQGAQPPRPGAPQQPGQAGAPTQPGRGQQHSLPGQPGGAPLPSPQPAGQPPGGKQQSGEPPRITQPSGVQQPGTRQPRVTQPSGTRPPAALPPALEQGAPGVPRVQPPGLQNRPALPTRRAPAPAKEKERKERRRF